MCIRCADGARSTELLLLLTAGRPTYVLRTGQSDVSRRKVKYESLKMFWAAQQKLLGYRLTLITYASVIEH